MGACAMHGKKKNNLGAKKNNMLFILVIKYFVGEDSKRMKDGD